MLFVHTDVVQYMIGGITDGCPSGNLFFRINHLVRSVSKQELGLHILFRPGNHLFSSQFFQKRSCFQRALEIPADGHNADIKISDAQ